MCELTCGKQYRTWQLHILSGYQSIIPMKILRIKKHDYLSILELGLQGGVGEEQYSALRVACDYPFSLLALALYTLGVAVVVNFLLL